MEVEAAAAVLQVLVQNLIDYSEKEISLIRGLEKDAAKLTATLGTIQKFLNDAEMRSIHGEAVKNWLRKLEDAAFDADNVLDEFSYRLLSKQIKPKNKKVLSCFSSFNHIPSWRNMALRIKEMNEDLDLIKKEATELQLVERLAADGPTLLDVETASLTYDPIFIGRDDAVSEIVESLTSTSSGITSDEHKIPIISIWGMGGLGKTTLTRKVFHHQKVETLFGSRIWVHVSQIFDPIILLKKVLRELTSDIDQVESNCKQDVLKKLQLALKDKTYILVLDDIWNQNHQIWEDFMNSLVGVTSTSSKGNAIVVTTRNVKVASIVKPFHIHELKGLPEEDCWLIIKAKTFGKEDVPSEFEAIGRKIARKCRGLPLAANVVGGILSNNMFEEKWLSIEEKWLSLNEGENITKILRLSFDNLSLPSLKKCFAYCSMFPKGHKIIKQELIELWMAEGFLRPDDGSNNEDMEFLGNKFINLLLHNSLLQEEFTDDYGNAQICVMHDLVHDLASSVLSSSNNADGSSRVRYMFLENDSSPIPKRVGKYLRTLMLKGEISRTSLFSNLEGLHALTLDSYGVKELPISIRKLIHLRHLDISHTGIEELPEWIGELFNLLTVRAYTVYLRKVPSAMKYLINLRHLHTYDEVELPAEIGRLTSLQTLTSFSVGDEKYGCRIEELQNLNNLKGKLHICNLERVADKKEAEEANLFKKLKLLELQLRWDTTREQGETNDENVLEGLQPHPNLKKLEIKGFKGKKFPSWTLHMEIGNAGLNNLAEIRLIECSECEEIPMLGHLPNLKSLRLQGLRNVKCISSPFYGWVKNKDKRVVFPALERLEVLDLCELAEWAKVSDEEEVKVWPQLHHLEISGCEELMIVPSQFSSTCLKHLEFGRIGMECLPDGLFHNNPNLSDLGITKCPNLRELPNGLRTLHSLEKVVIMECPNLERIANDDPSGGFTSLSHVAILECDALVCLPCEMVGPSLQRLTLRSLSSLTNLPSLMNRLRKTSHLTVFCIADVPNFLPTSFEISPFRHLQRLEIDVSMWGSGSSSMECVDGILQACCHSLTRLCLKAAESWECVPESIQRLTALYLLKLENFGVEKMPDWLGNLSSLGELKIYNCKKLWYLPSLDAMQHLVALKYISIEGCPQLCVHNERHNISHVPNIWINGSNFVDYEESGSSEESRARKHLCLSCLKE